MRVEADEVTWARRTSCCASTSSGLVNGAVGTGDAGARRERTRHYLGSGAGDGSRWRAAGHPLSIGSFGYFPPTLWATLYAQLRDAMLREILDLMAQVGRGGFQAPLEWLRERVHRQAAPPGARRPSAAPPASPPDAAHFIRQHPGKYGALYGLPL